MKTFQRSRVEREELISRLPYSGKISVFKEGLAAEALPLQITYP